MHGMRIAALVVTLAACGGTAAPVADPGARCAAAAARDVASIVAARGGPADAVDHGVEGAIAKLCVDDAWAEPVVHCFETAPQLAACRGRLTRAQRDHYLLARMQLNSGRIGRPKPPGAAPSRRP